MNSNEVLPVQRDHHLREHEGLPAISMSSGRLILGRREALGQTFWTELSANRVIVIEQAR
jgi:hypothetical protein